MDGTINRRWIFQAGLSGGHDLAGLGDIHDLFVDEILAVISGPGCLCGVREWMSFLSDDESGEYVF